MHRLIFIVLLLVANPGLAQTEITWYTLTDVRFVDKYSEEEQTYYYFPYFGDKVKALEGKEVYLQGYMLVLGPDSDIFILSRSSYADCFFCGRGGPESIVELKMQPGHRKFMMDELVTIKGTLKLNQDDIYQCNYILEDAVLYDE